MMRGMFGPDGFANSVAQRVKKVSNPEGEVVINMRSGSSPTFLKACTEFFGMKAAAPEAKYLTISLDKAEATTLAEEDKGRADFVVYRPMIGM